MDLKLLKCKLQFFKMPLRILFQVFQSKASEYKFGFLCAYVKVEQYLLSP